MLCTLWPVYDLFACIVQGKTLNFFTLAILFFYVHHRAHVCCHGQFYLAVKITNPPPLWCLRHHFRKQNSIFSSYQKETGGSYLRSCISDYCSRLSIGHVTFGIQASLLRQQCKFEKALIRPCLPKRFLVPYGSFVQLVHRGWSAAFKRQRDHSPKISPFFAYSVTK